MKPPPPNHSPEPSAGAATGPATRSKPSVGGGSGRGRQSAMRTSGIITRTVYRSFVELGEQRKKRSVSVRSVELVERLIYYVLLIPAIFFIAVFFVLQMSLTAAVTIALLWFVSFFIGGYLFYRSAESVKNQRPSTPSFTGPRDYAIEDGWFVERLPDAEKRVALSRVVDLTIKPSASLLDFGELGLIYLPFGSASEGDDQREFLEAIKSQLPRHGAA